MYNTNLVVVEAYQVTVRYDARSACRHEKTSKKYQVLREKKFWRVGDGPALRLNSTPPLLPRNQFQNCDEQNDPSAHGSRFPMRMKHITTATLAASIPVVGVSSRPAWSAFVILIDTYGSHAQARHSSRGSYRGIPYPLRQQWLISQRTQSEQILKPQRANVRP